MLSWFAFATADHGLGIATAFENTAALVLETFLHAGHAYLSAPGKPAKIDWDCTRRTRVDNTCWVG